MSAYTFPGLQQSTQSTANGYSRQLVRQIEETSFTGIFCLYTPIVFTYFSVASMAFYDAFAVYLNVMSKGNGRYSHWSCQPWPWFWSAKLKKHKKILSLLLLQLSPQDFTKLSKIISAEKKNYIEKSVSRLFLSLQGGIAPTRLCGGFSFLQG